ncbi:MAG: XdhC family protein, partial [Pseudomonadota bacterium]
GATGEMAGYVSNGCVDADLRLQALAAIADGNVMELVYGAGSPFVDLRLPCGGSVEIMIDPRPDLDLCRDAQKRLGSRQPIALAFSPIDGLESVAPTHSGCAHRTGYYTVVHQPRLRLVVAGRGAPLVAVAEVANALQMSNLALSPDAEDGRRAGLWNRGSFSQLKSHRSAPRLGLDAWTAVLCLYHAHEWEEVILGAALKSDAFFIGAMGSPQTQKARLSMLRAAGYSERSLARVVGPIGLIPSARDAHTLAVSALAQVVEEYRERIALRPTVQAA